MQEAVVIKNGLVIDPETMQIEKKDLFMKDGKFANSPHEKDIKQKEIDATGCFVAPGFIDMHVHVFQDKTPLGIDPDLVGIKQGVTTIVDAGSAGIEDFPVFKEKTAKNATEVLAFLNISKHGLCNGLSELDSMDKLVHVNDLQTCILKESTIVGLKARMSHSVVKNNGIKPLKHARKLADAVDLPIMVHIGNAPPPLVEILPLLKQGDIVTHSFHGKKGGILDEKGALIPEAREALNAGVIFDVGHGTSSFSYEVMKQYKRQYDYPFTISTDIYLANYDNPVGSLMTTMSKLLALGFPLEELVAAVTSKPAKALSLKEQGTFQAGTRADVTIFSIKEGEVSLTDSEGQQMIVDKLLTPCYTLREGKVVFKK